MGARMAVKGAASRQPGIKEVSGDPASRKNGESRDSGNAEMLDESRAPERG